MLLFPAFPGTTHLDAQSGTTLFYYVTLTCVFILPDWMVNLWDRNQVLSCFSVSTELGMWLAQRATYFLLFPYFIFCSTESSLLCVGFSLQWLLPLQSTGSRPTGFISCSTCGPGLSSSGARRIFLDQVWNTCPLYGQADCCPRVGSPHTAFW